MTAHGCLLLAQHDRLFEVDMDEDKQFLLTWLEEKVFDVAEKEVCQIRSARTLESYASSPILDDGPSGLNRRPLT
jgi:hypothetical protein